METEKQAQPKSLRERIMPRGSLREKLAEMQTANSTPAVMPKKEPKYSYTRPEPEPPTEPIRWGIPGMETKPKITKEQLKFQESSQGYRGMPYLQNNADEPFLDEIDYTPPAVTQPLKRIVIEDPRDAKAKDTEKQGVVIEDPEQLKVFNTIKAVADEVAPEYTDYLLRLAWYEGRGNPTNRNDNGEKGTDRGIFQINNKSFPDVPDEFADDPVKSTLWAISLIEAGKQDKWVANKHVLKSKIKYE
jgi:hypothetical protein